MTEIAMPQFDEVSNAKNQARGRAVKRFSSNDNFFRRLTQAAALAVLVDPRRGDRVADQGLDPGVSEPSALGFSTTRDLEPGHREVRGAARDLRHRRHLGNRDGDRGAGRHGHSHFSHRALSGCFAPADRHRYRAIGGNSKHHLRNLGLVRFRAVSPAHTSSRP